LVKIKGSLKIERTLRGFLNESRAKFYRRFSGKEEKVLYIILDALGVCGANAVSAIVGSSYTRINVDFFKSLIGFKALLDALLDRGVSSVEPPNNLEFYDLFDRMLACFDIAKYANLLNIQQTFKINEAEIEDGEVRDTREKGFYEATQMWVDEASAEPDWENWYFDNYSQDGKSVGLLLEHEFRSLYKLELNDLKNNISNYFEALSGDYISRRLPTLPLKSRWEVQQGFVKNMDKKRATIWLKELEYKPGRSLFKSPLIPLVVSGKNVYYIAVWAFKPSNHFFNYWVSEVLTQRGLKSADVWGQKYGDAFQRYLGFKLKQADTGALDLGSLTVMGDHHPEIIPWLNKLKKLGFQVDRVVVKGGEVYLVSCKADFVLDRKLSVRDLFFPAKELERRCFKNIKDMNEINTEAECVRNNLQVFDDYRRELVKRKTIVPIVVTSRIQPMAIPQIRNYYSKFESVPDVTLFTTAEFVEHLRKE
jgi:hypothetical protein